MRDKYFRIGSGTRLMSVVSFNSIWTPVRYDGYMEVGDVVDRIDYLLGELNGYGKLSIFHNHEGESMLDAVCSFLGMSKVDDSEPLESDSTKYERYLMDGEWRKKDKVKTGGHTVKFDVEEEKEKLRILNKKLEFYKEVVFSIIMFLTMLSGVFFLVFAVIKLLS